MLAAEERRENEDGVALDYIDEDEEYLEEIISKSSVRRILRKRKDYKESILQKTKDIMV